jgi:hypothetical protein
MDANEFYAHKEAILKRLSTALCDVEKSMLQLKAHERNAVVPDAIALEELEQLMDYVRDAGDWTTGERNAVAPMVEAAAK